MVIREGVGYTPAPNKKVVSTNNLHIRYSLFTQESTDHPLPTFDLLAVTTNYVDRAFLHETSPIFTYSSFLPR